MKQSRRRFADFFALSCGALTLVAYYGLRNDAIATGAMLTGCAVLIWSIIWPE